MSINRLIPAAGALLLTATGLAATVVAPAGAATAATLACTRGGVTDSAAEALAANLQTHAVGSDYTWSAAQTITLKSSLTITRAGTYRLRGTIANGQIIINSTGNGVVRLVLAGVNVTSSKGAAIEVRAAAKVVVVLQDGTVNTLNDGKTRAKGDTAAAALYSKAALTISGTGALRVNGRYADGIASTDGLVITGGKITVNVKDDGIRGKDFVYISSGTINVTATGDAIRSSGKKASTVGYVYIGGGRIVINSKSDALQASSDVIVAGGTLDITATKDGIKSSCLSYLEKATVTMTVGKDAVHSDAETVVRGGTLTIKKAYEGLEGTYVEISGGTVDMVTSDDGLNVAGGSDSSGLGGPGPQQSTTTTTPDFTNSVSSHLQINGGTIVVNALGDGIDINGTATMKGGRLIVSGPTANNNGALDVDGDFLVSGGMIIGIGSSGMAVGPTLTSAQAAILGNFNGTQAAGTIVHVTDGDGKVLASFKSPKQFASIVFTSSDLVKGKAYKIYIGGKVSGDALGGYYSEGSISGATLYGSLTAGSYTNSGPGGGGPRP